MEDTKIISFNSAQEVRQVVDNLAEQEKAKTSSLLEDLTNQISDLNENLGGFKEFAAILALPDDHFSLVAPIFLDELSKTFNDINDTTLLVQTMNAQGVKLEDVREEFDTLTKTVDDLPEENGLMTQQKKDFIKSVIAMCFNAIAATINVEKRVLDVPVVISENGKMPAYAHITDAGADIFAAEDMDILPGEHKTLKTGVSMMVPKGYEVQVRAKSGIAAKTNLIVKNGIGTIDEFYIAEIGVILANIDPPIKDIEIDEDGRVKSILHGSIEHIDKGQKIAQLVLSESPKMHFYKVETLEVPDGTRGLGGFGSTGK